MKTTYKCLCCGYSELLTFQKEEYSEVKVCPQCNGAFVDVWKLEKYKRKGTPLLQIELKDINSVPVVFYKGERIDFKDRVSFDYKTDNHRETNPNYIHIEYHDDEGGGINIKTIQHNQPIGIEESVL
jgi:Zn-finger nucleic acid-binding protein